MQFHIKPPIILLLVKILDILETKILGSNLIYTHHWSAGDLLLLNNPSLAHIAGPGSQASYEVTGLRLMHRFESIQLIFELYSNHLHYRSTVGGKVKPSKNPTEAVIPLKYECFNHAPFEDNEYCLFSLKVKFSFKKHST